MGDRTLDVVLTVSAVPVWRRLWNGQRQNRTCSGRRVKSISGWIRAKRTWAKTLPGTDSRVMERQLLQSTFGPFPLYSAIRMLSFQSEGTRPVLQTWMKISCKAFEIGLIAQLSRLGGIPSGLAARPFRNLRMAQVTSSSDGSSTDISGSVVASICSASSSAEWVPGRNTYTWWPKYLAHFYALELHQILTNFQFFFTVRIRRQFVVMLSLTIQSCPMCVATVTCDIPMS